MSFPRYPRYKNSGIEWSPEVPEHWDVTRLRYAVQLNPSKMEVAGLDGTTPVSFLPMEAIGEDGSLQLDRQRPISELAGGYSYFCDGDVVVAKITPCFENGKGAHVRGLTNGVGFGTTELIVARPRPGRVTGEYLHLLFTSLPFRQFGEAAMYGAGGQKRVPDDFVRDFAIALPPVQEQLRIAEVLGEEMAKTDTLVAEQRRLIELLKEKRQAVISRAVTKGLNPDAPMKPSGVAWLGEVPAHWESGSLKRYWSVTDCKHNTAPFVDEGVPLASIREVQSWFVDLRSAKRTTEDFFETLTEGGRLPVPGDLIFSRNASVGEVAQVAGDAPRFAMGQDVCLLRRHVPSYDSDFLQHVLRSPAVAGQLEALMIGSTIKRVNVEQVRELVVPMPPPAEQSSIARVLNGEVQRFDSLEADVARAIDLLLEHRTALISAAVTGKIDVRELAEANAEAA